ncbi:MAG: hypothetical protein KBG15_17815 [Kofleriaceae bacterium]|nr:hypothetical protein [Kofleriaceae bacterium]
MILWYTIFGFLMTTLGGLGGVVELLSNVPVGIEARDRWRVRRWLGVGALLGASGVIAIGATHAAFARDFNGVVSAAAVIVSLLALAPMTRPTNGRVSFVVMVGVVAIMFAGGSLLGVSAMEVPALARRGFASSILVSSLCLYALAADVRASRLTYRPIATAVATQRSADTTCAPR